MRCGTSEDVSARLTIDLGAIVANYLTAKAAAAPAEVACVVKADAYGLGAGVVSAALYTAGCRRFFTAQLGEALALRGLLPQDAWFYVLNGLWPGTEAPAADAGVVPVLNSLDQVLRWHGLARARGARLPAILQIDSGMSRLGVTREDVDVLRANPDLLAELDVHYVMTHLASADTPDSAWNAAQLTVFDELADRLPPFPRSFANTAAALTRPQRPGDLVRIGIGLYGGAPVAGRPNPMRRVVDLSARVLQVREAPPRTGVGYGMTYVTRGPTRIATLAVGYADGWPRSMGGRGAAFLDGRRLPVVGRVSMDSMMVDVTGVAPSALEAGDFVELLGPHQSLEDVAEQAGTVSYEILTGLGSRLPRTYAAHGAAVSDLQVPA
ncbi:MAG: alanine racemase [Phenylobacterium sp.]|uniref:alanine racemase n=1 Tax=Phenylobacterium sp. TaxID=1871053 RepID=UPI001212A343|nr:alanine racemase [Phenylobacterium sp.]TAJ71844.1 MAG: alanine racemase [Phenylobacterium sp.]